MFTIFRQQRKDKGFTLVELLVVILIVGILAGIAVPIYLNQKSRAYQNAARDDAHSIGTEVYSILSDYTSFGTGAAASGTISLANSGAALTFTAMTAATGSSMANAAGPGATSSLPTLTKDSTMAGTYGTSVAGNDLKWCIIVTNNSTYVKYTEAGEVVPGTQIGAAAPTCADGI